MLGIRLTFNLSILCNRLLCRNNREAQVMERTMENSNTQNLLQLHVQAAMQLANLCNMGNCPTFPANAVWPYPAQSNCHKSKSRLRNLYKSKRFLGVPGLNGSLTLTENGDLVAAKQPCSPQLLLSALAPLHNLQPKSPQKKGRLSAMSNYSSFTSLLLGILEKGLSLSSENNVHELRASERTSKRPVANKQGVKRPKRSRTEWSKREIIVLLQCARLMSDCELKTIVRVVYSYTKRLPGKCWGKNREPHFEFNPLASNRAKLA